MDHDFYPDDYLGQILTDTKTIAVVGASMNPARPSYGVFRYLLQKGYDPVPVNPGHGGETLLGVDVVRTLRDVKQPIDMIDVFRRSEHVMSVVEEVLALPSKPKVIWMQLGVRDDAAARKAEAAGIKVVMNRCPKIDYERLMR